MSGWRISPPGPAVEGAGSRIHTPLIALSKARDRPPRAGLDVDYGLTSTCYDPSPDGAACGQCEACLLRLKGFAEARSRGIRRGTWKGKGDDVLRRQGDLLHPAGRGRQHRPARPSSAGSRGVTCGPAGRRIGRAPSAGSATPSSSAPTAPEAAGSPTARARGRGGRGDLARAEGEGRRFVVCTGGEPLLQLDGALLDALHRRGFEVAVETNGTIAPPAGIDWMCVSPKAGRTLVVKRGDELKLVYPQDGAPPERFGSWPSPTSISSPWTGRPARPTRRRPCATASTTRAGDSACRRISFSAFRDPPSLPLSHARVFRPHQPRVRLRRQVPRCRGSARRRHGLHGAPGQRRSHLARYSCEQATIVAGILHHVLEETASEHRAVLEQKIADKFGPVVLAIARDAVEPKLDRRGAERSWQCVQAGVSRPARPGRAPRARHHRGRRAPRVRLHHHGAPPARLRVPAYGLPRRLRPNHLVVSLDARSPRRPGPNGRRREMLSELRVLSTDLVRSLRSSEDEL